MKAESMSVLSSRLSNAGRKPFTRLRLALPRCFFPRRREIAVGQRMTYLLGSFSESALQCVDLKPSAQTERTGPGRAGEEFAWRLEPYRPFIFNELLRVFGRARQSSRSA